MHHVWCGHQGIGQGDGGSDGGADASHTGCPCYPYHTRTRKSVGRPRMAYAGARAPSMLEELEQEMKLLHWHKLANEAALKAALIRSKRLKAKDNKTMLQESKQQERAVWIQKVLEEEQQKPLEVTDDFVRTHEARESRNREKLAHEVRGHCVCA